MKHGLTGAGIVIPDEDVEAVEERFEAFEADLQPANDLARFLARRAALLAHRLDRLAREEAARVTLEMLEAEQKEEDDRACEFEELTASFAEHPAESARKLRRSEEGIDWMLDGWKLFRRNLLERDGERWRVEGVLRLAALKPGSTRCSRIIALSLAAAGNFNGLEAGDWPELPPPDRRAAARAEIVGFIDAEVAGLEKARGSLDRERLAQVRAGAPARAIFHDDKTSTLARKYEASLERSFFKTLAQIEAINAASEPGVEPEPEPEAEIEVEAIPEPAQVCDELGSFFPEPVGEEEGADPVEVPNPIAHRLAEGEEDEEGWEEDSGDLPAIPPPDPGRG